MPIDTQLGVKKETVVGTAVTVDHFNEYNSEKMHLDARRLQSKGMRVGQRLVRADRRVPYVVGVDGPISFDVLTKGFAVYLEHLLGSVATAGPTDSAYTHTGSVGALIGKGLTVQANRRDVISAADRPFTWAGCKINKATLHCDKEGILTFEPEFVGMSQATATSLATAVYPSGIVEPFTFAGGALTIGGTATPFGSAKFVFDNKLKVDRIKQRSNTARQEPIENAMRDYSATIGGIEWDSLTNYNRVAALTTAGIEAAIVCTYTAPTLIGVSTFPSITVSATVSFDDMPNADVDNDGLIEADLTCTILDTSMTIAVVTLESTP